VTVTNDAEAASRRRRLAPPAGGYGLTGMRERLELAGGRWRGPEPGRLDGQRGGSLVSLAAARARRRRPADRARGARDDPRPACRRDVVGTAANGAEALELVARRRPDVVLMDLHMPVLDGVAATRRIVAEHPSTAVLILTTFGEDDDALEALRAGARGVS
jgi:CheY-like chemotaxis protein